MIFFTYSQNYSLVPNMCICFWRRKKNRNLNRKKNGQINWKKNWKQIGPRRKKNYKGELRRRFAYTILYSIQCKYVHACVWVFGGSAFDIMRVCVSNVIFIQTHTYKLTHIHTHIRTHPYSVHNSIGLYLMFITWYVLI